VASGGRRTAHGGRRTTHGDEFAGEARKRALVLGFQRGSLLQHCDPGELIHRLKEMPQVAMAARTERGRCGLLRRARCSGAMVQSTMENREGRDAHHTTKIG
jgi:hypothetical protein